LNRSGTNVPVSAEWITGLPAHARLIPGEDGLVAENIKEFVNLHDYRTPEPAGSWATRDQNSRASHSAHLFAGSHPKLARFGMGVALNRTELASGKFCRANSDVNAATLCSASARVAAVPRT
jgi:hypothetical protein